jgi:hypothetical protein
MVQAVLDAWPSPTAPVACAPGPQRYHDALAEAMRRPLASDLLPRRAGQPVKALVHVHFAELLDMDQDSVLQDKWIGEYRVRWAAHRAAASVSTGTAGRGWTGTRPVPWPATRWSIPWSLQVVSGPRRG